MSHKRAIYIRTGWIKDQKGTHTRYSIASLRHSLEVLQYHCQPCLVRMIPMRPSHCCVSKSRRQTCLAEQPLRLQDQLVEIVEGENLYTKPK